MNDTPPGREDFPKNHSLILIGQPALNTTLQLTINHDIRSRITYSAKIDALAPPAITEFIHEQLVDSIDSLGICYSVGVVGGGEFSGDKDRVFFTLISPKLPDQSLILYALSTESQVLSHVTESQVLSHVILYALSTES